MEQLRQNVTYDEILDMKVVDVGGEGRWISLFDADTPSVSMEAKKVKTESLLLGFINKYILMKELLMFSRSLVYIYCLYICTLLFC